MEKTKTITFKEVEYNNGSNGRKHYIILANKVYDVTGYDHPGGKEMFDDNLEDKYADFVSTGHSKMAQKTMQKLYIGDLER